MAEAMSDTLQTLERINIMDRKTKDSIRWALYFWMGTIFQMAFICFLIVLLRINQVNYGNITKMLFLAIGGLSSAMWGVLISKKSLKVKNYRQIFKDFFNVKQPVRYYLLAITFIIILFGKQLILGQTQSGIQWYSFIILFAQSILFGGIEEIGWRYTFQPLVEQRMSFEVASVITFVSWGIWHYMYFFITDTLEYINHISFAVGLLGSCFILGMIFKLTQSLWLCVMYHALLNVFSQSMSGATVIQTITTTTICVILTIFLVHRNLPIANYKKQEVTDK
jgi:membrane protease YdiL (CAAX protease family)